MSANTNGDHLVECPDCEFTYSADSYDAVAKAIDKHEEHTGHNIQLTNFEFELPEYTEWTVDCNHCGSTWTFPTKKKANSFIHEHSKYTDHDITNVAEATERELDVETLLEDNQDEDSSQDRVKALKQLLEELENHFEKGVPINVLKQSVSNPEMVDWLEYEIDKMKQSGEIYEPTAGRYRLA